MLRLYSLAENRYLDELATEPLGPENFSPLACSPTDDVAATVSGDDVWLVRFDQDRLRVAAAIDLERGEFATFPGAERG